jgi:predicted metal-dependent peptidase
MSFDLNLHVYRLLQSEPFYAAISRHVNKQASTVLPTAGVRVNKESKQFEMLYNPAFFEGLTDAEKGAVLRHEFDHLVYDHVTGRLPAEGMTKAWNIATDLAINSHIPNIPSMACIPGIAPFAHLEKGKSADYYFEELKKEEEERGGGKGDGKGEGLPDPFDDHSGWSDQDGDMDNTTNEIAKERLKEAIKKAAEECTKSNTWGTVTVEQRKRIMESLQTTVNWRSMLRYFVKVSQRCDKSSTVKRINKRYPRIHAGKKIKRVANIAISIDQSGSVSDNMLALFFSELGELANIATFTVIPFDTRVDDNLVYCWKKGKKHVWERVMCGGTDFNAPTKWVNKEAKFDGHIVLTDMCAPKPLPSVPPRMWMTDKENARNPYFVTNEIVVAIGK